MAKAKVATAKKKTTRKPSKSADKSVNEIKFADFVGKRLKDMGHDDNGMLTIKFENGYNIKVGGDIFLKKEKDE